MSFDLKGLLTEAQALSDKAESVGSILSALGLPQVTVVASIAKAGLAITEAITQGISEGKVIAETHDKEALEAIIADLNAKMDTDDQAIQSS